MAVRVTDIIAGTAAGVHDLAVDRWCDGLSVAQLLAACAELEAFRRRDPSLYRRVRALFFLSAIHRYHLPARADFPRTGLVPYAGFKHLLERRFEEAIAHFGRAQAGQGARHDEHPGAD